MSAVELRKSGLHLTGTQLSLDARRKTPLSFVSHAHADHIARHERVIATAATIRLMSHRLGELPAALPVPYGRPFELGPLFLELFPAGHILGSAQLRVTRADGVRIVYTGDLNLQPALTAERATVVECDTLVIESTFGHPRFRLPPRAQVFAQLEEWLRSQLARGITPILLGYPLGKSQEAMKALSARGFRFCVHPAIHAVSSLYAELGMPVGEVRRFDGTIREGEVGFFPPFAKGRAYSDVTPRATAVLTGWAMDPGAARRYGADVAFPVSDHADFQSLVDYAKATGATEVITHHGFARELAEGMRAQGIDARAVGQVQQLDLFA